MKLTRYKLGELIDVRRGASLSGEYYATEGDLIRLTLGNFDYQGGGFKDNTSKNDLYFVGPVKQEFILSEGDIITPLTEQTPGLLGSTAQIPESGKYIQSQDIALIIPDESKLDRDFCYYLLPSKIVKQQLASGAQQTKIRHTTPDRIKDMTVFIPELSEQRRVGKLLKSIDQKIALNREINRNLETMARQLYDYWFVQFDFPDKNGRPYKSSGGKIVWNEKLKREIPEGWGDTTLGIFCEMYQPKTIGTNELNSNGKYWVYGANGIVGKYDLYNHEQSEIAMACRGNSCGVVNRTLPKSWITGNAMVIKPQPKIHNEFIYQTIPYLNILGAISGSGQPQLTRENLSSIVMCSPSASVLEAFSKFVAPYVELRIRNEIEAQNLIAKRDELLPLLMNGQVSVTPPEINCDLSRD